MKAEWIYSIIKSLEARLQYVNDDLDAPQEEKKSIEEALEYFKNLEIDKQKSTTKENWKKKYDTVGSFSDGRAWVELNGKYGHVDKNGKITTPIKYDDVGYFDEGRAVVILNEKYGHVDKNGKVTWD